eukprot:scaffold61344_cov46-Phaeocystis_antarctica.AAC.1
MPSWCGTTPNPSPKPNPTPSPNPSSSPNPNPSPNPNQVRHYAGEVVYDCRGMLEKNADRLSRNLYTLLSQAGHRLP